MPPRSDHPTSPVRLRGAEAAELARREYTAFADLLDRLDDADWLLPTDCPAWNVHQLVAHVLGAAEANAQPREMVGQLRRGRRGTRVGVDEVSAVQVADRQHLTTAELRIRLARAVPAAVSWRERWRRLAGWMPLPVGEPINETWSLRYLVGTIYTRDVWMHRVDVTRATGREMELDPGHDGRIVEDVVAEWAGRHGRPYRLTLTGAAGGRYARGDRTPPEELELDAVEFCRRLSGRGTGAVPMATPVPF